MKIGFIGAGVVAQTVAKHALPFGHKVVLSSSRGPDSLAPLVKELGSGATAGTPQLAADQDIVVLAANWPSVQAALFSLPDWKDRFSSTPPTAWRATSLWSWAIFRGALPARLSRTLLQGRKSSRPSTPFRCRGSLIFHRPSRALFFLSPVTTRTPRSRSET